MKKIQLPVEPVSNLFLEYEIFAWAITLDALYWTMKFFN